jgi:plasmid stabilization system protein ParE
MAYRVRIMPRAERDLAEIYEKIEARTSDAARARYLGLKESIRSLRDSLNRSPVTPESGHVRHGRGFESLPYRPMGIIRPSRIPG